MKKDGYLFINVPATKWAWSVHDKINEHTKRYEAKELTDLLKGSGFKIHKIRYWGFMLAPAAYFIRRGLIGRIYKNNYKVFMPPKILNKLFYHYTLVEYKLTRCINLPFGLSLLAIVKLKTAD
jgi:hypothetical protein